MKKVLLINPNRKRDEQFLQVELLPPLGLAYLAAVLEQNGCQVDILDNYLFNLPHEEIVRMAKFYDTVGISILTSTSLEAIAMAKLIKNKHLICGGPHATLFPQQMLPYFDTVVVGESEMVIADVVLNERTRVVYGTTIDTLDMLPLPARDKLPMVMYPKKNEFLKADRVFSMNTSRGCPYLCSFCSVKMIWGKTYRAFSPEYVYNEIKYLIENYNANGIYFREDNFTYDRKRVEGICELIAPFGLEWVCESRVEQLDERLIKLMAKSGCRGMWFGTESGSNRVLKMLHKGTNTERAIETFRLCKKHGIKTGASFMLGLPGETKEEMYETLRFAHSLDSYWTWFNYFLGIPGSDLYADIIKNKSYERLDDRGFAYVKVADMTSTEMIQFHRWIKFLYHIKKPVRIWRTLRQLPPKTWILAILKLVGIYKGRL